jgi:SAM-dependent methyltransferase
MPSPLQALYESRAYPAMSHPLSDPAVSAVAARLGGLAVPHPGAARVLEIGCCSGLNLIPLALRWPASRFVGIDLAGPSIQLARDLARAAGVSNIEFHASDLRDFAPAGGGFDFILAHGFLSWVPDEVKAALFAFCHRNLTATGIATISYNLASGWSARFPVIAKARAIQLAGAADEMSALAILRAVTAADLPDSPELPIIDDMMAKGPAILPFDDFAPINDPWPLDRFVQTAAAAGLRWLGESQPANNPPPGLDPQTLMDLRREWPNPLACQLAADVASQRTFRSGVVCRADSPLEARIPLPQLLEWSVRVGDLPADPADQRLHHAIAAWRPASIRLVELFAGLGDEARREQARQVVEGIHRGWIWPRIEEVKFSGDPPARPELNAFRRDCVRRGLPLVDIWHQPCSFPARHLEVLAAMDGTRDQAALAAWSRRRCPELAFDPWLRHLAGRGLFAGT